MYENEPTESQIELIRAFSAASPARQKQCLIFLTLWVAATLFAAVPVTFVLMTFNLIVMFIGSVFCIAFSAVVGSVIGYNILTRSDDD